MGWVASSLLQAVRAGNWKWSYSCSDLMAPNSLFLFKISVFECFSLVRTFDVQESQKNNFDFVSWFWEKNDLKVCHKLFWTFNKSSATKTSGGRTLSTLHPPSDLLDCWSLENYVNHTLPVALSFPLLSNNLNWFPALIFSKICYFVFFGICRTWLCLIYIRLLLFSGILDRFSYHYWTKFWSNPKPISINNTVLSIYS